MGSIRLSTLPAGEKGIEKGGKERFKKGNTYNIRIIIMYLIKDERERTVRDQ